MELDYELVPMKKTVKELIRATDQLEKERNESYLKHADHIRQLEDLMGWTKASTNIDFSDRSLKVRAHCFRLQKLEEKLRGTSAEVVHLQSSLESLLGRKLAPGGFSEKVFEVTQMCSLFKEKEAKSQQLKMLIEEDETALWKLSGWKIIDGDLKARYNQVTQQCQKVNEFEFDLKSIDKRIAELERKLDGMLSTRNKVESVRNTTSILRQRYERTDPKTAIRPMSTVLHDSKEQRGRKMQNEASKPIPEIASTFSSSESISSSSISTSSSFKFNAGEKKQAERSRKVDGGMSSPQSIDSEKSELKLNLANSEKKFHRERLPEKVSKKKWGELMRFSFKDKEIAA